MEHFLYVFFVLGGFLKGMTAVIQTQRHVAAAVGEDARLSCQFLDTKEVRQVTWKKIFDGNVINIGSYERFNGETVNVEFEGKVQFKEAGLQNNSIVIRNVTEQDGGCYFCSFRTFLKDKLTAGTCLHVYELHEPVLQVRGSKSPEESFVSCSATGRPAPTVTLTVPQQHLHLSQHNTVTVTNTNNTVNVTTTAVLSGLHDDSARVGCEARVDSGPQVEVVKRITELRQTTSDDALHFTWIVVVILAVIFMIVVSLCAFILYKRNKHSDPEKIKTPQKPIQDEPEIKTALVHQEDENVRHRSPTEKHPENNRSKSSTFIPKQLF